MCEDHGNDLFPSGLTLKEVQTHYAQTRGEYVEKITTQERNLARYLITLSAGAFALTFTVYSSSYYHWALISSWILFALSLISILMSIKISINGHSRALHIIANEIKKGTYTSLGITELIDNMTLFRFNLPRLIKNLNMASFFSFIIGIIMLAIFSITNLKHGDVFMSQNKENAQQAPNSVQKGNTLIAPAVIPGSQPGQSGQSQGNQSNQVDSSKGDKK